MRHGHSFSTILRTLHDVLWSQRTRSIAMCRSASTQQRTQCSLSTTLRVKGSLSNHSGSPTMFAFVPLSWFTFTPSSIIGFLLHLTQTIFGTTRENYSVLQRGVSGTWPRLPVGIARVVAILSFSKNSDEKFTARLTRMEYLGP